jgi:hypothetical protein
VQGTHVTTGINESLGRVCSRISGFQGASSFLVEAADKPLVYTRMQALFGCRFSIGSDRLVHEVIMTHALKAEKLGPGGFGRCIELLLEKLVAREGGYHTAHGTDKSWGTGWAEPRVAATGDLDLVMATYGKLASHRTLAMLHEAVSLAGFAGRIIVEKTSAVMPSVELVRGYTFELQQLLPIDVSFTHPRAFCIDGYVEDVAEIHHLLEAAAGAKEPCVLFVRGMSDDVKHTLQVNYDRGSLRMVPVEVRYDLDGMNTLVDLSIIMGCDLVSSLKGDLISSIKFHEAPYVEQIISYKGRVVVTNSVTHPRVAAHVAELRQRRADEQIEDKGRLLDSRIKSLSPNHVVIRLPNDRDFVTSSQAIDHVLRAIKSMVDHGVLRDGRLVATELAARVHADRCAATLFGLGCLVTQGS